MNNRLTKIFVKNKNVLDKHNYVALPGSSTLELMHVLNNVIEDARENKKELWIILQDMSQAYDLVNRKNLSKAMERICLPKEFILLIENMLKDRVNQVITDIGLTDEYHMKNGIDQGETISPLLWIIYYNPLFEKIEEIGNLGYKMEFNRISNINVAYSECIKLNIEVNNISFMDDTIWLSRDKQNMIIQLELADSFNNFNRIKINVEKSKLIIINENTTNIHDGICYGKQEMRILKKTMNKSLRFLSVWIAEKNNKNYIKKLIKKDIDTVYYMVKSKKLTAEQIIYIINAVLIPRIEYKANLSVFNENEVKIMTSKIRRLLRNRIGITNTAPNAVLYRKDTYKLIDFYVRQQIKQIEILKYKLSGQNLLGITM